MLVHDTKSALAGLTLTTIPLRLVFRAYVANRLRERGWAPSRGAWWHPALTGARTVDLVEAFLLQNRAMRQPPATLAIHSAVTDPHGDWRRTVTPAVQP